MTSSNQAAAEAPHVSERNAPAATTVGPTRRVKVFTVHGTFANEAEWDNWDRAQSDETRRRQGKPRNFVNLLNDYLKEQGVTFESADHTQYNWSGNNSHDERRTSAIGLKKLIQTELLETEKRVGKPYKEYYDGGIYVIAHSHGGTISRIAMNLWDKAPDYYGPEKRVDSTTNTVLFDELNHDDHCEHCRQQRNGEVGPNTVERPDCVITFGSPFVTFEERSGGLLAAKLVVWSIRFLTLIPLLAYFVFVMLTSADAGAGFFGVLGNVLADPKVGFAFLTTPAAETILLLVAPAALYWLIASYAPKRLIVQVEKRVGAGTLVNAVAAVANVFKLSAFVGLFAYYVAFLFGGRPGVAGWLEVWNSPIVTALSAWLLPLLLYWLLAVSLPGRWLAGLDERVALLRHKLPNKYDPREERQAFYLNYHTPGDEPGLGLRLQGFITWLIQTLALAMACVLVAGIVLAIIGGIEALMSSTVMGGRGILGAIGLSPHAIEQQGRFIAMMDALTAIPRLIWNGLASVPGLKEITGGPAELRLGGLADAAAVAGYVPIALFYAVMTMLFNLLPSVLLALAVAFAVGIWLRNSMAGFGSENFAWTLASRIAISKRAGPNSMLRKINISRDAWWNRDIAHCYYYKSDAVTKDVADFIAHPERFKPDVVSNTLAHRLPQIARWLVAAVFALGIFAAAVPIARNQQAAATKKVAAVLTPSRVHKLDPGTTFRDCETGCPTMVAIPAGTFMMGSAEGDGADNERPRHQVTIAHAFAVSQMEVLAVEFKSCVAAGACSDKSGGNVGPGWPATELTWHDAVAFTQWLSSKTGKQYRLLSEAEWEYAARAGSDQPYSWGSQAGSGQANCKGCGSRWDGGRKAPAGSFKPNAFGLYDMHGNVWEWVEDRVHPTYAGAPVDGSAWIEGGATDSRLVRGGATTSSPAEIRSAHRVATGADTRNNTVGFRVARSIER